jgi:hypothetical protein
MTKSICASETRNIRYIVEAQGLNPQHNPQQGATTRYMVDSQALRYDIFWLPRDKIQFIVDSQAVTPNRDQAIRGRVEASFQRTRTSPTPQEF